LFGLLRRRFLRFGVAFTLIDSDGHVALNALNIWAAGTFAALLRIAGCSLLG
jgi:hypothetical protein